jgi:AcrR family transcriptional regulator
MTPTTTTDKGDATRAHILAVAAQAFADDGYAGTSLNDIIKATGLTKGGFYFHFPSKEQLALEVLSFKRGEWATMVMGEASRHPRAIDQLTAVAASLADMKATDPAYSAISNLCMELSKDPELEPETNKHLLMWVELTTQLLRQAQIEGDVRSDIDPAAVADVAVCAFIGMERVSDMHSEGPTLRQRVDQFCRVLLDAVRVS